MTPENFLNEHEAILPPGFVPADLKGMTKEEVQQLALFTKVDFADLVLEYGFGANTVTTQDLQDYFNQRSTGERLGRVAHVA
jgi:hypothetical protein